MNNLQILEHVALAPLTTLKVGGAARFFAAAVTENDVVAAFQFATEHELPLFILGGGSNVLISDDGFDGLVLQVAVRGIEFDGGVVTAGAGEDWDEFVAACVAKNLAGIECLSGIPGFVGGTPVQNVGAYGQEVSETIEKVRVFDRKSQQFLELNSEDCKFAYRSSIFNTTQRERFIVVSVTFRLTENGPPKIAYKDLQSVFGDHSPTLAETRDAVREIRASKAMLVRQEGADSNSAGSFFKNPVVSSEELAKIEQIAAVDGLADVPRFSAGEGFFKVPAAWLIEKAGFQKGYQKGNAGLSTKHTLALTNRGNATADEILNLKSQIQSAVAAKFGVELQPEPVMVGFG